MTRIAVLSIAEIPSQANIQALDRVDLNHAY